MPKSTAHVWRLPVWMGAVVMLALLAGHIGIDYYLLSHLRVVLGFSMAAIVFAAMTHLGLVSGVLSRLGHRHSRRPPRGGLGSE